MATVQDIQQHVNVLADRIELLKQRVSEDVQALRDQIAAAGVNQVVLDAVDAKVAEIVASVDAVDPDPTNPPV